MSKIAVFTPIQSKNLVVPRYPCGKTGETVDVLLHGTDYAVWKLIDDWDNHVEHPKTKKLCVKCFGLKLDKEAFEAAVLGSLTNFMFAASNPAVDTYYE